MADSMLMYIVAASSFIALSIILLLLKPKIRYQSPLVFPERKKQLMLPSRGKILASLKELFANENSIFDERNKDGRNGYFPWA